MLDLFTHSQDSIALLYGETFYIVPDSSPASELTSVNAVGVNPEASSLPSTQETDAAPHHQEPEPPNPVVAPPSSQQPGIHWRPKPTSKMLFVLQQTELKDSLLTDFLKKIVASVEVPFEEAGFGIIHGPVHLKEFEQMPHRYAVVFDNDIWKRPDALATLGSNQVFFTKRLAYLQQDADAKRELWAYLKQLKETLRTLP